MTTLLIIAHEKNTTKSEAGETPIYSMAVEMGIINLHELCKEIERLGGNVLDLNTDCARCTFRNNGSPFTVITDGNIECFLIKI